MLFDFATARYAVSGEGKCVLHLWSEERNTVRRVLDAECNGRIMRLKVLRFGQSQPKLLEICADRDRRSGSARRTARASYLRLLERVLRREYPGFQVEHFSVGPDLEHSFSPIYARGVLRAGQTAFAVLGVNSEEDQASIDAALTFGILWMDHQRQQLGGRAQVEGLKLFLPVGRSEMVRQRCANLHAEAAKWQLYELDERAEMAEALDSADSGNIITRLTRAVDAESAQQRFATSVTRIRGLAPAAEISVQSASEIVFRLYGLEFARACITPMSGIVSQQRVDPVWHWFGRVCARRAERDAVCRVGAAHHGGAQTRRLVHESVLPARPGALAGIPGDARRSRHR